ncbi:hypothetical protein H1Z61_13155 [Bacillus aquiflavi]|uniref:Glycosyltransferase family 4 protein n=1 Tax=Bacillus aquiflavi TaxID=2672567 RepID=A0A6B3W321_9BACI|nr:glycosyltransferase family 4 protein [Bacillus aquiflavi]MBA4538054.1 hypothetical protein [Bacillus aquiflavi]NEY82353.1 glycosyltransferase family 4 protein [Bacillus aquiflavi]
MTDFLFVTYLFSPKDGVGSTRSRAIYSFLKSKNIDIDIISRDTYGKNKSFPLWTMRTFFSILKSKRRTVYVSCGPFTHLIFVTIAAKLSRKRLIIDFRDPWSLNIKNNYGKKIETESIFKRYKRSLKIKISELVEKFIYKQCNSFIVCTNGMYESYRSLFKNDDKLHLIINGHTVDVKAKLKTIPNTVKFVCLGKFAEYNPNKALHCLKKINALIKQNPHIKYELIFVGTDPAINLEIIKAAHLDRIAKFIPRKSYKEAIQIAESCDIGLAIVRDEFIELGTKAFDYIGLHLPIFDCFEKDNNFRDFFKNYLSNGEKITITINDAMKFRREQILEENLNVFINSNNS